MKSSFVMHHEEMKPLAGDTILDSGRDEKYKIHKPHHFTDED